MFKFSILYPLRWNWLLIKQHYLRTDFKSSTFDLIKPPSDLISLLLRKKL